MCTASHLDGILISPVISATFLKVGFGLGALREFSLIFLIFSTIIKRFDIYALNVSLIALKNLPDYI